MVRMFEHLGIFIVTGKSVKGNDDYAVTFLNLQSLV